MLVVEPVRNHAHVGGPYPAAHELVPRARRDRDHGQSAVGPRDEPLGQDQGRGHRKGGLPECRTSEEVVRENDERIPHPEAGEEGKFVQVLDHHVGLRLMPQTAIHGRNPEVIDRPGAEPPDANPGHPLFGRRPREADRQQRDLVPAGHEPAEHLEAVDLRTPGLRVSQVSFVHHEDAAHGSFRHPSARDPHAARCP